MTVPEKLLHEQNGFVLEAVGKDHATGDWMSWIYHQCDGMGPHGVGPIIDDIRWCDVMYQGECRWCCTPIPKEIYGLWMLHNWDRNTLHK